MFNFVQLIIEHTRVSVLSSSLIDHILCNMKENIIQSGTIPIGLSDHFMIFCTRKVSRGCFKDHNTVKIRSLKNYSAQALVEALANIEWSNCLNFLCINTNWVSFRKLFTSIIDELAPIKEIRLKQRTEPWMDSYILDLIRERDRFLYTFKKHRNEEDYKKFSKLRNLVQREVRAAKSEYFSQQIEENKDQPKKLWKQLKSLGYSNKQKEGSNIVLKINGETCHDSKVIADHFNEFFTNVAANLVEKLPPDKNIFTVGSDIFQSFYRQRNPSKQVLVLQPVTEDFVFKELKCLNVTKSTGLDNIPARFLKDGAPVLKTPITAIINQSIQSGIVPDEMKEARVSPIYKKNSPLEVGNYRPVSILCIVSKILERSVYSQLSNFFITKPFIV